MAYEITAARKRPQELGQLAGQEFVSETLGAALGAGKIAHAYLFSGPRGCGKTSTARILAKALNCEKGPAAKPCGTCRSCLEIARGSSMDVLEIDGASNTSVDNIRQIKDEVLFPPNGSRYKIYIIDEVHMLSNSAFNALLKTIEEPPPYIVFIFATTEIHKVPATIKSRCQQFNFRLIPLEDLKRLLAEVAAEMGIEVEGDALLWMAKEATGSARDAYTLFDQVASFSGGKITANLIKEKLGLVGVERLNALFELCLRGETGAALDFLDQTLSQGVAIEQCVIDAVEYCRAILFLKYGIKRESLIGFAPSSYSPAVLEGFDAERVESALEGLLNLHRDMRFSVNPRFELELAVARLAGLTRKVTNKELSDAIAAVKRAALGDIAITSPDRGRVQTARAPAASPSPTATDSSLTEPEQRMEESTSAKPVTDAGQFKTAIIAQLGKSSLILAGSLEKSLDWEMDEDRVLIPFTSEYEERMVRQDLAKLSRKVAEVAGRPMKVELRAPERQPSPPSRAKANDEDGGEDEDPGGVADPVAIVERVFRGQRTGKVRREGVEHGPQRHIEYDEEPSGSSIEG